jgi:putative cardiolipin synthase
MQKPGTVFALFLISILFVNCSYAERPYATDYERPTSYVLSEKEQTRLKSILQPEAKIHPGTSGFHLITHGTDALMVRLEMIEAAERTLDLQYYSIQDDETGKLLIKSLLDAADRGVRVRLLIDDITLKKSDKIWSVLHNYPHIELRVFNPFAMEDESIITRAGHVFDGLGRFNKRMHNKVFIADNQLAIIGGRNLGDAYFGSSQDFNFRDLDVLSAGPIVGQISNSFDSYWNSKEAYPIDIIKPIKTDVETIQEIHNALNYHWKQKEKAEPLSAFTPLFQQLQNGNLKFIWAKGELAADSPNKIEVSREVAESKPANILETLANKAKSDFIIVSPYFIPGDEGVEWIKSLTGKGVKVRILTNSLGSTDVVAVHSGYEQYRAPIIKSGADLYELKPIPGKYPRPGRFSSSSRASLHNKIYVIDGQDIVVGTFNLDPRSIELNTEVVLVIHSKELAAQVEEMFEKTTSPASSFHLVLAPPNVSKQHLEWITEEKNKEAHYTNEPESGFWRRVKSGIFSLMPWEDDL